MHRSASGNDDFGWATFQRIFTIIPWGRFWSAFWSATRNPFEVIAFSFSPKSSSPTAKRIEAACDQFIDCSTSSDREVVALARSAGIDVAVDLMGYTTNCRPELFCMRVAPVQVNYLGYAGTMGAPWMDYIIADETVIPEHLKQFYTEKVVWMPDTYFPTDASRDIAPCGATRAELGLPSDGFVFCCVNNAYKIAPIDFDLWMRILSKAAGSVLWLADAAPDVRRRLVAEAEKRGVDGARLIFKQRTPTVAEHLGQLGLADLFLDTTYYNGHTTTYDALWAGLPVLTKPGNEFSDRVAASLIRALEMPELIASSAEEIRGARPRVRERPRPLIGAPGPPARQTGDDRTVRHRSLYQ